MDYSTSVLNYDFIKDTFNSTVTNRPLYIYISIFIYRYIKRSQTDSLWRGVGEVEWSTFCRLWRAGGRRDMFHIDAERRVCLLFPPCCLFFFPFSFFLPWTLYGDIKSRFRGEPCSYVLSRTLSRWFSSLFNWPCLTPPSNQRTTVVARYMEMKWICTIATAVDGPVVTWGQKYNGMFWWQLFPTAVISTSAHLTHVKQRVSKGWGKS